MHRAHQKRNTTCHYYYNSCVTLSRIRANMTNGIQSHSKNKYKSLKHLKIWLKLFLKNDTILCSAPMFQACVSCSRCRSKMWELTGKNSFNIQQMWKTLCSPISAGFQKNSSVILKNKSLKARREQRSDFIWDFTNKFSLFEPVKQNPHSEPLKYLIFQNPKRLWRCLQNRFQYF